MDLRQQLKNAYEAHRAGRLDEARRAYRDILSRERENADANNLLGMLYLQSGEPVKAVRHIRRALKSAPGNAQAHTHLGIAFKDMQRLQEAVVAFRVAAELEPGNADYQVNLGNALRLTGRPDEAVQVLEAAMRKASGNDTLRGHLASAQNELGAALVQGGRADQAVLHLRRAVELEPRHPQALLNLGITLEQAGDTGGAAQHYGAAIQALPDLADAHFRLARLPSRASTPAEIARMKSLAARDETPVADRVKLAYGLGCALDRRGDHAEAFECMRRAHGLQAGQARFDLSQLAEQFEAIRTTFSAGLIKASPGGLGDLRPVFVSGMPASGTALAARALAGHPSVHGAGEQPALAQLAGILANALGSPFPGGFDRIPGENLVEVATAYIGEVAAEAGNARLIIDSTPMNFQLFGLAALMFPAARFVVCLRDPMDNGLALYREMRESAHAFCHDLADLGGFWRLHRELVGHWEDTLRHNLHLLRYEDLVTDPETTVKKLLEFVEQPYDEACLEAIEAGRTGRAASIGAWKHYAKELAPLKAALEGTG